MLTYPWLQPAWDGFLVSLERGRLAHALLLQGPDGVGKSWLAEQMAAKLLCLEDGPMACGECRSCRLLDGGAHPDHFLLTREVNPNNDKLREEILVGQVRALIGSLQLTTSISPRKVARIVPAERMNASAANALLKTLEEPPGESVLLLVSGNPSGLPVTIRSRCQRMAVPPPARQAAVEWLVRELKVDEGQARTALRSQGDGPLAATRLLQSGEVELCQVLWTQLAALVGKPGDSSRVASSLAGMDPRRLWLWLGRYAADVVRSVAVGRGPSWLPGAGHFTLRQLADLQADANRNRRLAVSPVRQDLLLQEWLIKWAALAS